MSRSTSTKKRNAAQALVANKPTRRNRRQQGHGEGVAGMGVSGGVAVAKNDDSSSTKDGERKLEDVRNKCHHCLEPGHRWFEITAHIIPTAKKSRKGSGEIKGCLAIGMLGERHVVGERGKGKDGNEKWTADNDVTFHMTRSADLLRDLHPSDKVKIGNGALTGVEGYGSLIVVFPNKGGGIAVRLEKVAYVPDVAFNLFSLMTVHTRGVGFATDYVDMSIWAS